MICGIYKIENIENGKVYIGKSKNIFRRWIEHQHELQAGKHHSTLLQEDWNKYGSTKFTFQIIKECNENELDKYEEKYSFKYNSLNKDYGYNVATIGDNKTNTICAERYIDSEKYIVDLSIFKNYSNSKILSILYLIVNTNGDGYILYKNNKITKSEINNILFNTCESYNRKLCNSLLKNKILITDGNKLLLINKDKCRKVYQYYANCTGSNVYIYKNIIKELYENNDIENVFKLFRYENRIDLSNNKLIGDKRTFSHEMERSNVNKYNMVKKIGKTYYLNPMIMHNSDMLGNIHNMLKEFDNSIYL